MRRHHHHLFLLTFALASTSVAGARAQPPPDAPAATSAAATERARKLFVEAARLYDEGKYPQAYVAFAAAWAIKKHPSIAGNLADCEVKVGKYRDAAEHLRYIVKDTSGEAKPEDKRRARERLDEVTKRIGVLTVSVAPTGAELVLDAAPLGASPLPDTVFADPGQHTLEAHADGYVPSRVTFDVAAGAALPVRLALVPKGDTVPPTPPPRTPIPRAMIVTGGILAAGGLAAGIGLTVAANAKGADALSLHNMLGPSASACFGGSVSSACQALENTAASRDTFSKAAVGAFVAGGALALATAGLGVWTATRPHDDARKVTVRVLPGVGGATVIGQW
jgi:hypothetical protein